MSPETPPEATTAFEDYLASRPGYASCEKTRTNYLGISKKEAPKWEGWKIISNYRKAGVSPKDIQDKTLDCLVENYYYVYYLQEIVLRDVVR